MREIFILLAALFVSTGCKSAATGKIEKPNFIIIFVDDLGYNDIGCFGAKKIKTPHIDSLAKDGMKFTSFYAQTVCGPSRAALMTGSYPLRVATHKNKVTVHPELHLNEITIAEVLKTRGYATGAFGKWDLAGHSQTRYLKDRLPLHQGFDYYYGTPSSNDSFVNIIRNNKMIELKAPMKDITKRFSNEAISFIKRNKEKPFFVYLAHPMPHVKLASNFNKSEAGIYGDVVEEIDFYVGKILKTLKEEGLEKSTYVIFTSDNGPWYLGHSKWHKKIIGKDAIKHGGSALPLRGAKTSTWEGGLRVPFIVKAPGVVPANTIYKGMGTTMDLLPTLAGLAGAKVPKDRVLDGIDLSKVFHAEKMEMKDRPFFYYQRTYLRAVRFGKWKLHIPGPRQDMWANYYLPKDVVIMKKPMLYDLENDISESKDVAAQNPKVVKQLMKYIEHARNDIGDYNRIGKNARFFDKEPKRPDIKRKK